MDDSTPVVTSVGDGDSVKSSDPINDDVIQEEPVQESIKQPEQSKNVQINVDEEVGKLYESTVREPIIEPEYYSDLTPEQIDNLLDIAKDNEYYYAPKDKEVPQFTTMSLSTNLQSALKNIYDEYSNIRVKIDNLFKSLPTTGRELQNQIQEAVEFVVRQDKWIVLRIDSLASVVASQKTSIDHVAGSNSSLWTRVAEVNNDLANTKSSLSSLWTKVGEVNNDLASTKGSLSSLWTEVGRIDNLAITTRTSLSSAWDSIATINNKVAATDSSLSSAWTKIAEVNNSLSSAWTSIGTANNNIAANAANIKKNTDGLAATDSSLSSAWTRIAEVNNSLSSAWTSIGTANNNIASNAANIKKNTDSLAATNSSLSSAWQSIANANNKIADNSSDITTIFNRLNARDTRYDDFLPSYYFQNYPRQTVREFKEITSIGLDSTSRFGLLITEVPWNNHTGGLVKQILYSDNAVYNRYGNGNSDVWSAWQKQATTDYVDSEVKKAMDSLSALTAFVDSNKTITDNRIDNLSTAFVDNKVLTDNAIQEVEGTAATNRTMILATDAAVIANKVATDNRIEALEEQLSGLKNYDDTALRDEFKRFDANHTTIEFVEGEGSFTKFVKFITQYTVLKSEIEFLKISNTISELHLQLMDKLTNVNEWLRMIYEKEFIMPEITFPELNIPTFDYDRLSEMIESISFGTITNEAGTNIWDVLKSLTDGLSDVIQSILDIVPELIQQIIDLIIPEDPEYFSKKFESVSMKLDTKFAPVLELGESVKGVFSTTKSVGNLTVNFMGKEYRLFSDTFLSYLPTVRMYTTGLLYLYTLIGVYRRFVGEGDVIS